MQTEPMDSPVAAEKRRLRAELRAARRALDGAALARAADAVAAAARALPELAGARTVAGYVACDGEVDVTALLDDARARGAAILLPRCLAGGGLELVAASSDDELVCGSRGNVREPRGAAVDPAAASTPAVILVPSVALDRSGMRLGRGGGDYDRLLPVLRALGWTVVGVCHAAQLVERLPAESHDQRVDVVLTDEGVLIPVS